MSLGPGAVLGSVLPLEVSLSRPLSHPWLRELVTAMAVGPSLPGSSARHCVHTGPSPRRTQLPFSQSGVLVEQSASYLKVVARLGLVFMWNQDGSLLVSRGTAGPAVVRGGWAGGLG